MPARYQDAPAPLSWLVPGQGRSPRCARVGHQPKRQEQDGANDRRGDPCSEESRTRPSSQNTRSGKAQKVSERDAGPRRYAVCHARNAVVVFAVAIVCTVAYGCLAAARQPTALGVMERMKAGVMVQ